MVLFSLHNFFQSWPGPGVQQEVNLDFCHTTPILVNGPFVALGETVCIPRCERFLTFRSRVMVVFVKKVYRLPTALWGLRLPVTALALSVRRSGPARFARGLDNENKSVWIET